MKNYLFFVLAFYFAFTSSFAQVVINELDCDTPGIDEQEFVELKSDSPNFPLDGYVVVFFNGSAAGGDSSYMAIDLDGYVTDDNGLLLMGSTTMTPFPQLIMGANSIQNGADAVAVYQANASDFPQGTLATQDNLIDALVYGTNDADDEDLMELLGVSEQINEGASGNTDSIQRNNDGTYFVATPTPRDLNDGSGIQNNPITISTLETEVEEGESFDIIFTAQSNVTTDYTFDFSLNNYGFSEDDYIANTSATILAGQNSTSVSVTLIDDEIDEGDEEMLVAFGELQLPFIPYNNYVTIRVVDNDFTVAPFGTPINPTYGIVESTQPQGYYDTLDGLSEDDLKQALQDIIAEEGVVRAQTYRDVIDILKEADQNPENSNQVWLVYLEEGLSKLDFQTTSDNTGKWNREHTFPRSRGGFYSIDADDIANGIEVYWNTTADSLRHGNSDAHAIRAVYGPENSIRSNQFYGQYNGPEGTLGGFKGDVARSIFYMTVRYNGLEVVNGFPEDNVGQFGDLNTLLDWHRNDPPDDYEMNRNNVVYNWQYNRNPFIDYPDLVEYIWGNMIGETWHNPLKINGIEYQEISFFPNPTKGRLFFKNITGETKILIYNINGQFIQEDTININGVLDLNLSQGMYIVKMVSETGVCAKKLVVN